MLKNYIHKIGICFESLDVTSYVDFSRAYISKYNSKLEHFGNVESNTRLLYMHVTCMQHAWKHLKNPCMLYETCILYTGTVQPNKRAKLFSLLAYRIKTITDYKLQTSMWNLNYWIYVLIPFYGFRG